MNRSDPTPVVAFQGEAGAYSERAIARLFPAGAHGIGQREARDAAAAVERGEADHALLPVENTLAGTDLDMLERVLSHPVALAQCTGFFRSRPGLRAEAVYDTAGAAREVARAGSRAVAAIAGEWVAESTGLAVLARDIEDRPDNQTRFLLLAPAGSSAEGGTAIAPAADRSGRRTPMKTMLLVEVEDRPGALVDLLATFAVRGLNLTWIEARPTGRPWSYRFFIELVADARDAATVAALEDARRHVAVLRVLGSFPKEEQASP